MLKFPRQPEKRGGWTIPPEYLKEIEKVMEEGDEDGNLHDSIPSWEQIEMVLLAIEKKMNTD